jgi:hypothetical protein
MDLFDRAVLILQTVGKYEDPKDIHKIRSCNLDLLLDTM